MKYNMGRMSAGRVWRADARVWRHAAAACADLPIAQGACAAAKAARSCKRAAGDGSWSVSQMGELDEEAPCNMRLSAEHDMPWLTSSRSAGEGPVLVTGDCGCVGAGDACRYEHYSIIFNTDAKKTVKAATADSLMRYITSPDYPSMCIHTDYCRDQHGVLHAPARRADYGGAFAMALCVYKMFWTFEDLLRFLWQRFSTQAPREWPEDEREKYRRQFIEPVQERCAMYCRACVLQSNLILVHPPPSRVIKMVSLMIGRHYIDYYDNVKHIAQIINLCLAMAPTHSQAAERLLFMLYVKVFSHKALSHSPSYTPTP